MQLYTYFVSLIYSFLLALNSQTQSLKYGTGFLMEDDI